MTFSPTAEALRMYVASELIRLSDMVATDGARLREIRLLIDGDDIAWLDVELTTDPVEIDPDDPETSPKEAGL
jgi:hypothetical protein